VKITCPPGYRADSPPVSSTPFWYFGENVRFRLGVPETVGLYTKLLNSSDEHARVLLSGGIGDFYADKDLVMVGSGTKITVVDWVGQTTLELNLPDVGATGRWWFTSTERTIIAGRANNTGKTYTIDRSTLAVAPLPNAPDGGVGAGIVNGILVKAGTQGFAGDGPQLVVRWSARRTDASSTDPVLGPFGFEDWTPSDVNASGEFLLDDGSECVAGVATTFGFVVWTDTRTYLLQPRNDVYVFTLSKIAQRGILSPKAYGQADGRLWWWDASRTLNVFDGGAVRQVPNTIRHASVDRMDDVTLFDRCAVSVVPEYGEIILHYPDATLGMRELVYNYVDDCWYMFNLGRIAMTDAQGERAAIGIDSNGFLYFYDVREALAYDLTDPPFALAPPASAIDADPEPFDFFLMTNHIAAANAALQSLRARNVFAAYTVAAVTTDPPLPADEISVTIRSWGSMDLRDPGISDEATNALGEQIFGLRAGGKRMQFIIHGQSFRSLVRLGEIDLEVEAGGEK
jgi:hypothetical protein